MVQRRWAGDNEAVAVANPMSLRSHAFPGRAGRASSGAGSIPPPPPGAAAQGSAGGRVTRGTTYGGKGASQACRAGAAVAQANLPPLPPQPPWVNAPWIHYREPRAPRWLPAAELHSGRPRSRACPLPGSATPQRPPRICRLAALSTSAARAAAEPPGARPCSCYCARARPCSAHAPWGR